MQKQVYKCPSHGLNLNNMRLNNKWCDVIINVEGKEYPAHKNVLAANLTHFEAMFNNDSFQESQHGVATMKNMRAKDLEAFIIYAYTGELTITDVNALDLLELADYLREDEIKDACIDFLGRHLKAEDAFRAYRLADVTGYPSLKNSAKDTIMKNFEGSLKTPDYLDLEYENLKDILSGYEAKAIKPQQMFDGIMRWTMHDTNNRKNHVDGLLVLIDSRRLTPDHLMSYLYKNVIGRANESEITKSEFLSVSSEITKSVMSWYYTRDRRDQATQQNQQALMIMSSEIPDVFQWFDFTQKKWSGLQKTSTASGKASLSLWTNAAVVDDNLYYIYKNGETHNLGVFDPMTKQIRTLHSSSTILKFSAVSSCSRFVYLCGGWNVDNSGSDQVLRYEPVTNSVEQLPSMGVKRSSAASIFYEGCLHVLGGYDGASDLNSVEKYDPETKTWSSLPSMCQPRMKHAVAVLEGKLYACGGGAGTNSVEVFDPHGNIWKPVASMNKSRYWFVLVAQGGKLWAIGGDTERTVEFYDPSTDQWQMDPEMSSGLEIQHPMGGLIARNCNGTA